MSSTMRWRSGETVGIEDCMTVLLLWTRPIASIHNIDTNYAGALNTRRIGDYRDSGLVHRGISDIGQRLVSGKPVDFQ